MRVCPSLLLQRAKDSEAAIALAALSRPTGPTRIFPVSAIFLLSDCRVLGGHKLEVMQNVQDLHTYCREPDKHKYR
jgi:hypothetical protein